MEMLEALRNANLKTAEAYRMRCTLQDFYEQANPQAAKLFLEEWIAMVLASGIEPMIKVAQTFQTHAEGVLRWFRSGLSNGFLEGLNSLVKAAKARGYRKIRSLIAVAYLIAGKLKFKVGELWPASAEAAPERGRWRDRKRQAAFMRSSGKAGCQPDHPRATTLPGA